MLRRTGSGVVRAYLALMLLFLLTHGTSDSGTIYEQLIELWNTQHSEVAMYYEATCTIYTMVSPTEDMQSKNVDLSVKTSAIYKAEKFSLIPTKAGSLFDQ